jgi:hypothetical protein
MCGFTHVAFPHSNHFPSEPAKSTSDETISLPVPVDLGDPVLRVPSDRELSFPFLPVSTVPEISITKNGNSIFADDEIRTSWQVSSMQLKTHTSCGERAPKQDLGRCVFFLIRCADSARSVAARREPLEARSGRRV